MIINGEKWAGTVLENRLIETLKLLKYLHKKKQLALPKDESSTNLISSFSVYWAQRQLITFKWRRFLTSSGVGWLQRVTVTYATGDGLSVDVQAQVISIVFLEEIHGLSDVVVTHLRENALELVGAERARKTLRAEEKVKLNRWAKQLISKLIYAVEFNVCYTAKNNLIIKQYCQCTQEGEEKVKR